MFGPRIKRQSIPTPCPTSTEESPLLPSQLTNTGDTVSVPVRRPLVHIDELFSAGSIGSAFVALCSSTLGVGSLSLPWAFQQCGAGIGTALLLFSALASVFSIRLLVQLYAITGITSFVSLAYHAFGKGGRIFTQIVLLIISFGAAVSCIVAVGNLLPEATRSLLHHTHPLQSESILQLFLITLIMLPLCFFRRISTLRVFTLIATVGFVALALVFAVKGGMALHSHQVHLSEFKLIKDHSAVLLALPLFVFAFTCQLNVLQIYGELDDKDPNSMAWAVDVAAVIEFLVYLIIAATGSLLFDGQVHGNVLENFDMNETLSALTQLFVCIAIILTFPLNIYPARQVLESMLFEYTHPSRFRECSQTILLVLCAWLISLIMNKLQLLFALLGSTCCFLISYIMPTAFYLTLMPSRRGRKLKRTICWILLCISTLLAIFITAKTLQYAIDTAKKGKL
jgi:amino acid permease